MNEPGTKLRTFRNVAIVAILALGLAVLPAGGNIANGVLRALSLGLLFAVGLLAVRYWRQSSLNRDAMSDRQRGLIYGGLGAIALVVAGTDELFSSGIGTVVWLAVMVASVWLIVQTWREAQSI